MEDLEKIRWKRFKVGYDGFVCLVDWMGSDASVVQAARVSYGNDKRDGEQETSTSLIRYLMRHHHTTPFEMCEVKLLVRVPMDCWRQWIRHRTASVNEFSTRYKPAIDSKQKTDPKEWRLQSQDSKQGSSDECVQYFTGMYLSNREAELHDFAEDVYEERLRQGVANELARKDLPLSTYTEAYWKIDLHNLFNFLDRRMDSHAQKEIRDYANIIGNEIVWKLFPVCYEAFLDYRRYAIKLSALDIEAIKTGKIAGLFHNQREEQECREKLKALNINHV